MSDLIMLRSIVLLAALCAPVAAEPYAHWGTVKARAFGAPSAITIVEPIRPRRPTESLSLRIGEIEVDGALDTRIVRRHIKREAARLSYCYERELLKRPQLRGVVAVTLEIHPDGVVRTVTASGLDPVVAGCVALAIAAARFPPAKRDVVTARVRLAFGG